MKQIALCQRNPVAHAVQYDIVVEIIMWIVKLTRCGFVMAPRAKKDIAAGSLVEHEREVFGPHDRLHLGVHVFGADDFSRNPGGKKRLLLGVVQNGISPFE